MTWIALGWALVLGASASGCSDGKLRGDATGDDPSLDAPDIDDGIDGSDTVDTFDGSGDPSLDSGTDGTDPVEDVIEDPWADLPDLLVAEDEVAHYEAPGEWPGSGDPLLGEFDGFPAAWSGRVYMIPMIVPVPGPGGGLAHLGVFRFDPVGETLTTSWSMMEGEFPDLPVTASVCWSGEAFIVVFPMPGVGIYLLTFDEAGDAIHPLQTLGTDLAYDPYLFPMDMTAAVFCPEDGPFLLDPGRGADGTDRIHHLTADGALTGTQVDVDLPTVQDDGEFQGPCPVFGREVAYLVDLDETVVEPMSVVFFNRDGNVRIIDAWSEKSIFPWPGGIDWMIGYDLINANGNLALVFTYLEIHTGEHVYQYSLMATDDTVIVRPRSTGIVAYVTDRPVATASDEYLLVANTDTAAFENNITLYLLEFSGEPASSSLDLDTITTTAGGTAYYPGLFWEGDAFGGLWTRDVYISYQRFVVIEG